MSSDDCERCKFYARDKEGINRNNECPFFFPMKRCEKFVDKVS